MATQIAATPILKGNDAVRAINAANRKPSDASRKGEAVLAKKFASMLKK